MKDPRFWEKVLGPKPADGLMAALNDGVLTGGAGKLCQWVADLTAVLDDVFTAKNETHNEARGHSAASAFSNSGRKRCR